MTNRSIFAFIGGLVVGAAGMWLYAKRYYEYNAESDGDEDDDIESVTHKELLSGSGEESEIVAYHKAAEDYKPKEEVKLKKEPYKITPDEFGEETLTATFLYYDDGVVADELGDIVDDVEEAIGTHFTEWFGEYEDDTAFVRNESRHCDYEILREGCNYYKDSKPPTEG